MTSTYLVAGTASHVGKSTVAAGLCRLLADRGVDVAPFKAQNMSNNARAVPRATNASQRNDRETYDPVRANDPAEPRDDAAFGEIGVSQYVQARAARGRPTTDCNPVLLKPRGDAESQLVLDGVAVGHYEAGSYYDEHWDRAREVAEAAHARLAAEHDAIVAEGAGAIAEPNLRERDLANVEAARFADAEVLLVADLKRGGAFASVVGTVELLPDDLRERIAGVLLNKFRGDASLLDPAIEVVEERVGAPVMGVLPHEDPGLPAEDSVDLPARGERAVRGEATSVAPAGATATVAVPRLPRISNFTDLEPLAATPGLCVSYRPLDDEYADADAVVVPGSKNAVDDLLAARDAGLDDALAAFDGPIVGLCGGYQLLGERISNAAIEGTGDREVVEGFGLLPVETAFEHEKVVRQSRLALDGAGPLAGADGVVAGYEIHMGRTRATDDCATPFALVDDECDERSGGDERTGRDERAARAGAALGAARDRILGTYLHGLFENDVAREAFARAALRSAGAGRSAVAVDRPSPYDSAAALLLEHADLGRLVPELR